LQTFNLDQRLQVDYGSPAMNLTTILAKTIPVSSVLIFSFCLIPEKRRSARFRRRSFSSRELKDLNDGKEIYETLTQASDPDSVKVSVPVMRFCFYL